MSFTYDENGIRTSKTYEGVTTYYTTENGVITSQYELDNSGNKVNEIIFIYNNGELVAAYYNNSLYYYLTNLAGDVIEVIKENGDPVVLYFYDAWGKAVTNQTTVYDTDGFGEINPMKYRSYYCDEWDAYYLQSRYYLPIFSRFLNADTPEIAQQSKGEYAGLNLFAYCNNDSVNNIDCFGKSPNAVNNRNITCSVIKTRKTISIKGKKYEIVYPTDPIKFKKDKSWSVLYTYSNTEFSFASFFKDFSLEEDSNAISLINTISAVLNGFNVKHITAFTRVYVENGKRSNQLVLVMENSNDKQTYRTYAGKTINLRTNMNTVDEIIFSSNVKKYYKKLTGKNSPYSYNTICVSVDKKHKEYPVSYFIICKKDKVCLKPIIFSYDSIDIKGRNFIFGKLNQLYNVSLDKEISTNISLLSLKSKLNNIR
jgi:RHS repeat-associated protein